MPSPKLHAAWSSCTHGTHSSPSSTLHSSSQVVLPSYVPGSLIPQSLTNSTTKLGISGQGTSGDVEMDGMAEGKNGSASNPPMPPADSLKMKAKQYQEAQEHYKEMVN
eukprot:5953493-Karenia_brevis.AAC.1